MPNAKKAYVSDGTNWLPLVSGLPDLTGYATTEYVDEFVPGKYADFLSFIWIDEEKLSFPYFLF